MKETHTHRKNLSHLRRIDSPSTKSLISELPKCSPKVAKKNLNAEFSSISDDFLTDSVAESSDLAPISEVLSDSDINHNEDSIDNFECLFTRDEALSSTNSSESSKKSCSDCDKIITSYANIETDMVTSLLKQATAEVSTSNDVSPRSKRLLDSLVEVYMKECCSLPQEMKLVDLLISEKTRVVIFCFAAWLITIMAVTLVVFHRSSNRDAMSFYLPPT